jgi:hypothetical protein
VTTVAIPFYVPKKTKKRRFVVIAFFVAPRQNKKKKAMSPSLLHQNESRR